jgi:hypothetical protein
VPICVAYSVSPFFFRPEQNCNTWPGGHADIQAKDAASRKSTLRE